MSRPKSQSGFAMLLVFVMAASIALMLYRELPRVAFEAQRNKEELLIERGEQYRRAIQVYYRKFKRYPASLDDLENTNNIRFLRRRYVDPMTGKEEWRLIHIGPGGQFTDSLVRKPPGQKEGEKSVNTFTWEAPSIGSTGQPGQGAGPAFPAVRPSEQRGLPLPGQGTLAQTDPNATPGPPPQPGLAIPGASGQPQSATPGQPGYPTPPGYPAPQNYPGQQPYPVPAGFPTPTGQTGQAQPGQPTMIPGYPFPVGPGTPNPGAPSPYSTVAGAQGQTTGVQQPGTTPAPANNAALGLIQQILTTPRAGPSPVANTAGTQIIGGIAGVASTLERPGIKIYNEREQYNEWEFLYDISQDKTLGAQAAQGTLPQQPGQAGQPGQQGQQPQPGQGGFGPGLFPNAPPFGQPGPGSGPRFGGGPGQPVTPRGR